MKKIIAIASLLIVLATLTLRAYYGGSDSGAPVVTSEAVTRGPIVTTVSASGTLEAVTTVLVGTQVSGTIESLHADFNSVVRKGQVLARLEPSLYRSAIEQASANLVRAQADLERLQVAAEDARVKLQRATMLTERQLLAPVEREAAEVAVHTAEAQIRSAQAQVTQARAALSQAKVNLDKTIITSPIDGIVISRNVDVGQTVAASLQAPTLFEIAADLSRMQLKASVDESDLGQVAAGQQVEFTVDAFPGERFEGHVEQVRLSPVVVQNVVTYAAIISAPNPQLKLKPGMTANVTVVVERRDDVLRVPNAALRFRPPDAVQRVVGGASAPGTSVWQHVDGELRPVAVHTGLSDGAYTEVLNGALSEGAEVVTRVATPGAATAPAAARSSPLMPSGPARR